MDFHAAALIEQEPDDDRQVLIVAEISDLLLAVFVEDVKVVFGQVGDEAALVVGDADGDDDIGDRNPDRFLGAGPVDEDAAGPG